MVTATVAAAALGTGPVDRAGGRASRQFASRRRFVLIGIATFLVIAAATAVLIWMQRESAIAAYSTATSNLGNGMAQQTAGAIGAVDRSLGEIAEKLTSEPDSTSEQIKTAMRSNASYNLLIDLTKRLAGIDAMGIVNAEGAVENSSGVGLYTGLNLSEQDFFIHFSGNDDHRPFVSVPSKSGVTGQWSWFLARRIDDSHGKFSGVVIAEFSVALMEDFFRTAMPPKRTVSIFRADGVVLLRYPHSEDVMGKKVPAESGWHKLLAQGGGIYRGKALLTNTQIIAFVRPLKNLPLSVQASVAEAEVLVDWPMQIAWLVLGAVLATIGVFLLLRYLANQVERLEQSEKSLAAKNDEVEAARGQFDAALSNISLGVCFFSGDKKLVVCNNRYRELYNLKLESTRPGTPFAEIVDQRFAAGTMPSCTRDEYIRACEATVLSGERRQANQELINGRTILVTHQPMPWGGWVATHDDITERREADRHISFLAHHDVLTGLMNRAAFAEKLDDAVARMKRYNEPFAVLMLDLDRFKNVNDTLGHPAGDQLLRETAQRLKSSLRETDVLARLGGDEFAIIQSGETDPPQAATSLANRILKIIAQPFNIDGNVVSVGTSIGVAFAPNDSGQSTDMLKMADLALYAAKGAGRQGFCFFEPAMLEAMDNRRQLEEELRAAISNREFELHYQALIDVNTSRQAGFEALVRWRSPTRGLVMPDAFIPLAEETKLIVPLGAWILQQACADAMHWPSHIRVSVNLSPVQLSQPDLLEIVLCALVETGLAPERLELEITETALFKNDLDCVKLIRQLKNLGVSIALDDFGTGYSSLSFLTTIPFDKIKIDRSFTSNLTTRADCAAIVAAVLALGRTLDTETVAEGVETEEQLAIVKAAGVSLVQGYLFGRPRPASELVLDGIATADKVASAA
jgi:diguanylate cyclase (GGDEF)-like protein